MKTEKDEFFSRLGLLFVGVSIGFFLGNLAYALFLPDILKSIAPIFFVFWGIAFGNISVK